MSRGRLSYTTPWDMIFRCHKMQVARTLSIAWNPASLFFGIAVGRDLKALTRHGPNRSPIEQQDWT